MMISSAPRDSWQLALEHTRGRSPATFEQWFSSVGYRGFEGGVLRLTARDEFVRDWVASHFVPTLVSRLEELEAARVKVEWTVDGGLAAPICPPPVFSRTTTPSTPPPSGVRSAPVSGPSAVRPDVFARPETVLGASTPLRAPSPLGASTPLRASTPPSARPSSVPPGALARRLSVVPSVIGQLNPKFTFDNFIVGPSNALAYAAALSSAGGGGPRYNPLFIAGGTGLGKTHLMHAIAHKVLSERPDARIVYVSAEFFTNEFIEALQNHRMDEFRARYRAECDLLLLDDIQFLAGREQTQEEFFHTFNALHDAGVPIIVTSDKYPQQLQRMPERLVSRFTSGLVADVQAPQLETRVAILKKKAQIEGIDLPDHVAVLLAQKVQSNVRELEGALIRLAAKASLTGRLIDEDLLMGDGSLVQTGAEKLVCVADIQKAVCSHFRVTSSDLLSKDRHKSVAFARQVAMYLCRQRLKSSFPELGRAFGNRDHTTIMSAVRRVETLRKRDPQVNATLEAIERKLASAEE